MNGVGLRDGDEATILIILNRRHAAEIIIQSINSNEVATSIYVNKDEQLFAINEALGAALSAIRYQMERPNLKRMLQKRIAELRDLESEADEDNPPAPLIGDIPF